MNVCVLHYICACVFNPTSFTRSYCVEPHRRSPETGYAKRSSYKLPYCHTEYLGLAIQCHFCSERSYCCWSHKCCPRFFYACLLAFFQDTCMPSLSNVLVCVVDSPPQFLNSSPEEDSLCVTSSGSGFTRHSRSPSAPDDSPHVQNPASVLTAAAAFMAKKTRKGTPDPPKSIVLSSFIMFAKFPLLSV